MELINIARDYLKGKKTYIVGGLSLIVGLLEGNIELISLGLVSMSGRAAISKIEKELIEEYVK